MLMLRTLATTIACTFIGIVTARAQVLRVAPDQELTAPRPAGAPSFAADGRSNGEWLAVYSQAELHARDPLAFQQGAVHLYRDDGGSWRRTQSLWSPSFLGTPTFGRSIAFGGPGELFIGMHTEATNGPFAGTVFRYELNGGTWSYAGRLDSSLSAGLFPGSFGEFISYRDGRLLVLEPDYKEVSTEAFGRLHTYEKVGGDWTLMSILAPPAGSNAGGHFENVIDTGDQIFIPMRSPHRVLVYRLQTGSWSLVQTIPEPTSDLTPAIRFGDQVAYSEGVLAVSDRRGSGNTSPGRVYIYERIGGQWTRTQTLRSGSSETDNFGKGLAISGNRLLAGVPLHHYNVAPGEAPAAWLYEKQTGGEWTHVALLESELSSFQAVFGDDVILGEGYAMVGDVLGGVAAFENAGTMSIYTLPIGRAFCEGTGLGGQPGPELSLTGAIYLGCESVTANVSRAAEFDSLTVLTSLRFRDATVLSGHAQGLCLGRPCFLSAGPQPVNAGTSGPFECALSGVYPVAPMSGTTVAFQAVLSGATGTAVSNAIAATIP
jgi:hypothetical protein